MSKVVVFCLAVFAIVLSGCSQVPVSQTDGSPRPAPVLQENLQPLPDGKITGAVVSVSGNKSGEYLKELHSVPGGFVAYWKFDENSWVGVANEVREVKSRYHGTVVGGANTTPVVLGRAGLFDGANDSVSASAITLANAAPTSLPDATISFWVKPDRKNLRPRAAFAGIFELGDPAGARYIIFTDGNMVYTTTRYTTAGTVLGSFRAAGLPDENRQGGWVHIAVAYAGKGISGIYINGQQMQMQAIPERTAGFPQIPWNGYYTGTVMATGLTAPVQNYKGIMDEPIVYNKILTGAEMRELYLAQITKLVPSQAPPEETPPEELGEFCLDHDLGEDYYNQGYIETFDERSTQVNNLVVTEDVCASTNVLKEYSCSKMGEVKMRQFTCPRGCLKGACKLPPASTGSPQCFIELSINEIFSEESLTFSLGRVRSLYGDYGYKVRPLDMTIADYSLRVYGSVSSPPGSSAAPSPSSGRTQPELLGQYSMQDPTLMIIDDLGIVERLPNGTATVTIPYDKRITKVSVFDGTKSTDLGFRISSAQCVRTCKLENETGSFFTQGTGERQECCPGQSLIPVYSNVSDTAKFVCTKCGNGTCGAHENPDNCPLDCR